MIIGTAPLVAPIGPAENAMQEVIPGQLWIGNAADARRPADLLQTGIRAVVDLAYEELPPALLRELILIRVPLTDGEGNSPKSLELAISSVEQIQLSAGFSKTCRRDEQTSGSH